MASALLEGRVLAGHCMNAVGCACASQRDQCNHSHGVPQKIAFCACNSPGATHCPFFFLRSLSSPATANMNTMSQQFMLAQDTQHARGDHAASSRRYEKGSGSGDCLTHYP